MTEENIEGDRFLPPVLTSDKPSLKTSKFYDILKTLNDGFEKRWKRQIYSKPFVSYRWIVAFFFISAVIATMIVLWMNGKYFIYLTHWGLLLCLFTNIYGAIIITIHHFHPEYSNGLNSKEDESQTEQTLIPWSIRIYWTLHSVTLNLAVVITIVYWVFLYKYDPVYDKACNIVEHLFNSLVMLTDAMIVVFPIKIVHLGCLLLLGLTYVLFSLIFYFAGGTNVFGKPWIYPILNWEEPSSAIITVVGVLFILITNFFILLGLYKLRIFLSQKYKSKKYTQGNR